MWSYESRLTRRVFSWCFSSLSSGCYNNEGTKRPPCCCRCVASTSTNVGFIKSSPPETCSINGYHRNLPRACLSSTVTSQVRVVRPMYLFIVSLSTLECMGEIPPRRSEKTLCAAALLSAPVPFLQICIQVQ